MKTRLQQLNEANEKEKKELEMQMSHVIHSQAGQLASQRQKISALQSALESELAVSHNRIVEQEREIKWLKRYELVIYILLEMGDTYDYGFCISRYVRGCYSNHI